MGIHDFDKGEIISTLYQKEPLLCKKKMAFLPDNPDLIKSDSSFDFVADIYRVSKGKEASSYRKVF